METLARMNSAFDASLCDLPSLEPLGSAPDDKTSIVYAMDDYLSLLDAVRDGLVNPQRGEIPDCPIQRAHNLKSFTYFLD